MRGAEPFAGPQMAAHCIEELGRELTTVFRSQFPIRTEHLRDRQGGNRDQCDHPGELGVPTGDQQEESVLFPQLLQRAEYVYGD